MINLDSVLKSRDITAVKAMVFPVVTYGCESWKVKKAEFRRIESFKLWCWRRLLRVPWIKEIKSVKPKGNQHWIFIGRTDAETEAPILRPSNVKSQLLEKTLMLGKSEDRRRWLDGIIDSTDMSFEQTLGDSEGQGSLACWSPWGHKESDMTEWLNDNNSNKINILRIKYCF